jgi:hypothetical protein
MNVACKPWRNLGEEVFMDDESLRIGRLFDGDGDYCIRSLPALVSDASPGLLLDDLHEGWASNEFRWQRLWKQDHLTTVQVLFDF